MASTRITTFIAAPRERVYAALLDPEAVARWRVPLNMRCEVHEFHAVEGGAIKVSLTYEVPGLAGKTRDQTDTYHGRFLKLVPNELVVEADEFETDDPALRGEMVSTIALADAPGGTELIAVHEHLPPGLSPAANEDGWREALGRLAALVSD